jgi:hypothetical protein
MPSHRNALIRPISILGVLLLSPLALADSPPAKPVSQQESANQRIPDAGLKTGMDAIRHAVLTVHADITESRFDSAGYQRLATSLDQTINTMLKDQSVSDKAGKAFHTIVMGDLRWGIDMMRTSPKTEVQRLGALSVFQALRNYGQFFAHPGWNPIP